MALGARLYSPERSGVRSRGYLQLAPALFWLRGARHLTIYHSGLYGEPPGVTRGDDSFTVFRPGLVAGAGVRTRIGDRAHAEWGVRYLYSGRMGLNTLAFVVGVGGTP